jgi:hypothetical protein
MVVRVEDLPPAQHVEIRRDDARRKRLSRRVHSASATPTRARLTDPPRADAAIEESIVQADAALISVSSNPGSGLE